MSNILTLKKSSVSGVVPTAGSLAAGEPTLNYADAILFAKDSAGVVRRWISETIAATNANAGSIVIGQPVYQKTTSGSVDLAKADSAGASTWKCLGLVANATVATTAAGAVQMSGPITLTAAQIAACVDGAPTALVPGTEYFVSSSNAGKLSTTCPAAGSGSYICRVGVALTTLVLKIDIQFRGKRGA